VRKTRGVRGSNGSRDTGAACTSRPAFSIALCRFYGPVSVTLGLDHLACPEWVNRYRIVAHRKSLYVRRSPKATVGSRDVARS
jgi:hypothetical protein